jgi:starch phosphorylase
MYLHRPPRVEVAGTNKRDVIAYFSPEFGITHVLPQYSGGLGILAGDHLKAASDLGSR